MADASMTEVELWLDRAQSGLKAAESLAGAGLFDDAISRAYYAMFYAAVALLSRDGLEVSRKHTAVLAAFGREYVKTGRVAPRYHQKLIEAFEWRQRADYDVFWNAGEDEATAIIRDAREFLRQIAELLKNAG